MQDVFYYRQLWVNTFEIHNLKESTGHCYVYHKGQIRKGLNKEWIFLHDYIFTKISNSVKELHLFSNGCPGQKRNHTRVKLVLAYKQENVLKKSIIIFPWEDIRAFLVKEIFLPSKGTLESMIESTFPKNISSWLLVANKKIQIFYRLVDRSWRY